MYVQNSDLSVILDQIRGKAGDLATMLKSNPIIYF